MKTCMKVGHSQEKLEYIIIDLFGSLEFGIQYFSIAGKTTKKIPYNYEIR